MKVFTFWEPKDKMPGYIKMCIRTWERCLPDAEIEVLDFKDMRELLTPEFFDAVTYKGLYKKHMAQQVDVYRAFLLKKYGGMWIDADTIITPKAIETKIFQNFSQNDVTMFTQEEGGLYGGIIYSPRADMEFMRRWTDKLEERVRTYRKYFESVLLRVLKRPTWRVVRKWNYFLNSIIDPFAAEMGGGRGLSIIDSSKSIIFPERYLNPIGVGEDYAQYYFSPGSGAEAMEKSCGIIALHNSWTPEEFRRMSEDEFIRQDVRLADLFRRLQ